MVGKAHKSNPGAPGGGTVSNRTEGTDDVLDIDLPEENLDAEAVTASLKKVNDTVPDLTGRGTPGGRISDLATGQRTKELGLNEERGMGAGSSGNLGSKHSRAPVDPDDTVYAGGGASEETTQLPPHEAKNRDKSNH